MGALGIPPYSEPPERACPPRHSLRSPLDKERPPWAALRLSHEMGIQAESLEGWRAPPPLFSVPCGAATGPFAEIRGQKRFPEPSLILVCVRHKAGVVVIVGVSGLAFKCPLFLGRGPPCHPGWVDARACLGTDHFLGRGWSWAEEGGGGHFPSAGSVGDAPPAQDSHIKPHPPGIMFIQGWLRAQHCDRNLRIRYPGKPPFSLNWGGVGERSFHEHS